VDGPAAAKGHQGELAGVVPALDRHDAQRGGHARVDDVHHGGGGADGIEAQRAGNPGLDGRSRAVEVHGQLATQ
jgi:hypothetical protein